MDMDTASPTCSFHLTMLLSYVKSNYLRPLPRGISYLFFTGLLSNKPLASLASRFRFVKISAGKVRQRSNQFKTSSSVLGAAYGHCTIYLRS